MASIPVALFLFMTVIPRIILRRPNPIDEMRSKMNSRILFPWTSEYTPRVYLYSDADQMVPAQAVEDHFTIARAQGLNVRAEHFHGSAHVSHARGDPQRYWGAIRKAWSEALTVCGNE